MPKSGEDAFMEKEAPVTRQEVETREKHAKTFEKLWNASRKRMKDSYDKKHKSISFRPGEKVLLSNKNFRIRKPCKKLTERYLGPFKVEQPVSKNAYRLILPESYSRMHNTFHVSLLEPYNRRPGNEHPGPVKIDKKQQYLINRILEARGTHNNRQYRVR
jgi:hypothetical protein